MAHILMPSTPIYGHLSPMIAAGRGLVARGHTVTVLTSTKYRSLVEQNGMSFVPLPTEVDFDDADLDSWLPGRDKFSGLAAVRNDLIGIFARTIPAQHRALTAELATGQYDAVVSEGAFMGALPTLLTVPATERVPFIGISALPITLTSRDTAPYGPAIQPGTTVFSRIRNVLLNTALHAGPLKPIQTAVVTALAEVGAPKPKGNFFDQPVRFDITLQLAPRGIEYPRRELPSTVQFIGPLRPEASRRVGDGTALPTWWDSLNTSRPVVHVTQGTLDNTDPTKLIIPTIRALADLDVLVVASTGGAPVEHVLEAFGGTLPRNARVASFLPYGSLLPKTSLVVSNGGFGGVQQALSAGIPLLVAGSTEDKPEVAARVAWAGAGVDLRSGRPTEDRIRAAAIEVLENPSYRAAARRLQDEIAALGDPLDRIAQAVEQEVAVARATRA